MTRSSRTILAFAFSLLLIGIGVAAFFTIRPSSQVASVDQATQMSAELKLLRDGLSHFAKKLGRYPTSLEEMVTSGIIPAIPPDPVTGETDTWRLIRETTVEMDDFVVDDSADEDPTSPIVDIRSGASGTDPAGVAWSDY